MEDEILKLYFIDKLRPVDIAAKLDIKIYKITRVIQKDDRYINEKISRKTISEEKHKEFTKDYMKEKRKNEQFKCKVDDLVLKTMHNQASMELSKRNHLTDENYRKWNYSAYNYNSSKRRYEFDENLGRSYDVPKYIKERFC